MVNMFRFAVGVRGACVALVALGAMAAGPLAGVAEAKRSCRTLVVDPGDRASRSVTMHVCDRVKVKLAYFPEGIPPSFWNVSNRPSGKVLKLVSKGGDDPSRTDNPKQFWVYRGVGKGRTSVKFALTTPSYPDASPFQTFKLSVRFR